jgi:hypothetical protein
MNDPAWRSNAKLYLPALVLLLSSFRGACVPHVGAQQEGVAGTPARVLVWVRDAHGAPVRGLTADDFVVTENGVSDAIEGVQPYFPDALTLNSSRGNDHSQSARSSARLGNEPSWTALTHVLIIIGPMSPAGRQAAFRSLFGFLSQPEAGKWKIALLDDAGNYVPYGRSSAELQAQARDLSSSFRPYANREAWYQKAARAIEELALLPGRHVIVFACDDRGVSPSVFTGVAIRAQSPVYLWRTIGPEAVIPGGGAAETQSTGYGPIPTVTGEFAGQQLSSVLGILGYLDPNRVDFDTTAEETGGVVVRDLKDAFTHIAEDAAGYYLLYGSAHPSERDGTWHPIEVTVRSPHASVKGPHYYMAPSDSDSEPIPAEIRKALLSVSNQPSIPLSADGWLFPDRGGIHLGAFAAELDWPENNGSPPSGSRVRLYVELINESLHGLAGAWYEEAAWPSGGRFRWQREIRIYPGSYVMRIVGVDSVSGKTGFATYNFVARPLERTALRFSALVLAAGCLSDDERAKTRRNLFDPMLVDQCNLAPTPTGRFNLSDQPRMMIRLYPPSEKFAKLILKKWKAYAVMDDAGPRVPMELTQAPVRGLVATGTLRLDAMRLNPGLHKLRVVFEFPADSGRTQRIPFSASLIIEP